METLLKDSSKFTGKIVITKAKLETPEQWALHETIVKLRKRGQSVVELVRTLNSICKTEQYVISNLLPTVGRTSIADHLSSTTPSPSALRVNNVAVGTGTTAPANADTTLETETYRNNIASQTSSSNISYQTGFFSATEVTGNLREAALFINGDGTGNPDTGTLLSRALITVNKTGTETLTIDWTITIS